TLDAVEQPNERPPGERSLLGATHFRRRHHLHRFCDLRGATNGTDPSTQIARAVHSESSLISNRQPSRTVGGGAAPALFPGLFELVCRSLQLARQGGADGLLRRDLLQQLR